MAQAIWAQGILAKTSQPRLRKGELRNLAQQGRGSHSAGAMRGLEMENNASDVRPIRGAKRQYGLLAAVGVVALVCGCVIGRITAPGSATTPTTTITTPPGAHHMEVSEYSCTASGKYAFMTMGWEGPGTEKGKYVWPMLAMASYTAFQQVPLDRIDKHHHLP